MSDNDKTWLQAARVLGADPRETALIRLQLITQELQTVSEALRAQAQEVKRKL